MSKGLKTYSNLTKSELLEKLTDEFHIEKEVEKSKYVYNAATGTLHVNNDDNTPCIDEKDSSFEPEDENL